LKARRRSLKVWSDGRHKNGRAMTGDAGQKTRFPFSVRCRSDVG
jgi:hypothetical protein